MIVLRLRNEWAQSTTSKVFACELVLSGFSMYHAQFHKHTGPSLLVLEALPGVPNILISHGDRPFVVFVPVEREQK